MIPGTAECHLPLSIAGLGTSGRASSGRIRWREIPPPILQLFDAGFSCCNLWPGPSKQFLERIGQDFVSTLGSNSDGSAINMEFRRRPFPPYVRTACRCNLHYLPTFEEPIMNRWQHVVLLILGGLSAWVSQSSGQEPLNVNRLAHPDVAAELGLDDTQRAAIQDLLQSRTATASLTDVKARTEQVAAIDKQIEALLTPDQWQAFVGRGVSSKLSFQFRDQKWDDVLNWFARQEGLTLVMDRVPTGSFTYGDTRSYTAAESIDLLNSVLSTRGFTLVRRERMLLVLELSESIPLELLPRVTLEQLPGRGRFELVSIMFPLGTRPVDTVLQEVKPYLGSFGRAIPLAQSRQLLVVETAGKMPTISQLIASVPELTPASVSKAVVVPVFAAYALGNLEPQATLKAIKSLVDSERITVDERTRVISAYLSPAQQLAVKDAIEQMILQQATLAPLQSIAYPLGGLTADALTKQITAVAPRAVIVADASTSRLLVTAESADHERIAGTLKALGVNAGQSEHNFRAFQVGVGQAATVAAAIRSMVPLSQVVGNDALGTLVVRGTPDDLKTAEQIINRWRGAAAGPNDTLQSFALDRPTTESWQAMVAKLVPDAKIWIDPVGKRLMVLGSASDKQLLESLLPQLLTALPPAPDRRLKVYSIAPVQGERIQRLRTTMSDLFRDLKFVEPNQTGELLVWGAEQDHAAFASLLQQLEQAVPEAALRWPKVYPLTVRDSAVVLDLLRERFARAKVSLDSSSQRLTVLADESDHRAITELLQLLAVELPRLAPSELKRYELSKDAVSQFTPLKADLEKRLTPLQLTVDVTNSAVWAWGPPELHVELEKALNPLQQSVAVERQRVIMAYTLQHADAAATKLLLDQVLKDVTLVADAKRGQLVATGTISDQARIKATIDQLDQPSTASKDELRSYVLKGVQAASILPALQSLWPRMTLSADATSNRIVASGNSADQQQLQISIDRLSSSPTGEPVDVRTYHVPFGDFTTLPSVLTQIAPQAVISADVSSRTVIVWGTAQQHERLATALDQLSKTATSRQEMRIFELTPTRASSLKLSLATLFPAASTAVDTASGRLIVMAPKELHDSIGEIVEGANDSKEAAQRVARKYEVPAGLRATLPTLISTAVPGALVVTPATDSKSPLVILAQSRDHEHLEALLAELVREWTTDAQQLTPRVYTLGRADPLAFAALLAEMRQNAKIIAGSGTPRLVITDTPAGHERIERLVSELQHVYGQSAPGELRVYRLRGITKSQAIDLLTGALGTGIKLISMTDPELIAVSAAKAEHEQVMETLKLLQDDSPVSDRQLRIFALDPSQADATAVAASLRSSLPQNATLQANTATNSLIAVAPADAMMQLEKMLTNFQQQLPESQQRETRIYGLQSADPAAAVKVLQALLPKATIAADPQAGSLAATGTVAEQKRIAEFVQASNLPRDTARITRSYALSHRDPASLQRALAAAFPSATLVADIANGEILATAKEAEHQQIADLVDKLNQAKGKAPSLTTFRIRFTEPRIVAAALQQALSKRANSGVSFDDAARAVFFVGTDDEMEIARQIIEQIDVQQAPGPERSLRMFALKGIDGRAVSDSVKSLYRDVHPPIDVRYDTQQEQLIVIGSSEQLQGVERLLQQFDRPERQLEVFALKSIDPQTMRMAVESLFADQPISQSPVVTIDDASQRLLVRGTTEQLISVRELLGRLGEPESQALSRGGRIRSIPVNRNTERVLRDIERVWPTIRDNRIQIFRSDEAPKPTPPAPLTPPANSGVQDRGDDRGEEINQDDPAGRQQSDLNSRPVVSGQHVVSGEAPTTDLPPIVVIPGPTQWTIASDDIEALDQFESLLLRSLVSPRQAAASTGNYSIYLLQHAGAEQLEQVLSGLFRGEKSGMSDRFGSLGRVTIVADPRMNALLVHGNRSDRNVVEEMLAILDSQELVDTLQTSMPRVVALRNTDATRIMGIVRDVYRSQLQTGGGRKPLTIPEGVSAETSAILQQINANASGPLLTLSVDSTSNSLIIRAPMTLMDELVEFVDNLDQRANLQPSTRMEVIRLNAINVNRLRPSLERLIAPAKKK